MRRSHWLWVRDQVWPFCGWRPGRMHTLTFGRVLSITAEAICTRCGRRWMVHRLQPGKLPWDDEVEAFFQEHMAEDSGS